ncbi:MAG: FAD-dependent oxidoreductase, partial [Candidatus Bathyarchaeota archaeon]
MGAIPKVIDDESRKELRKILKNLVNPVKLLYFTQEYACPSCVQQKHLLEELTSLSEKFELQVYDFVSDSNIAKSYGIERVPATVVVGEHDYGIRFYGLTAGYEFTSLLESILMVSTGLSGLDPQLESLVKSVKEDVHIKVFVTLTCPYCPKMVHAADQFALANEKIRADMIEVSQFPELAQRYEVTGVPKTVINERHSFEGALPTGNVYLEVLKAVNPEEYSRLEEAIRELHGARKARPAEEDHLYEVVIIGGGPAAMSAAIYAVRKGLDTALIAKKWGGQITYTANIENYLGIPTVGGVEMVETFRNHMESYPVAESLGANVVQLKKEGEVFVVVTEDKREYKARTIIYCAGMEYRRLGVPNEDRFIGKGIGFCATCDAPLYQGKRVAIVGGGNSAFTAARDLMKFASEIHLIHRRKEFRADKVLLQEAQRAKNVTLHTSMVVRSFLGKDKLSGVRLESIDGKKKVDLNVEGVFLEIGLTPNTKPLKGLIKLNSRREVPVNKDQSTTLGGLFSAGDVTDVEEKQISIAVGQG